VEHLLRRSEGQGYQLLFAMSGLLLGAVVVAAMAGRGAFFG